jgi:hypothetical protein
VAIDSLELGKHEIRFKDHFVLTFPNSGFTSELAEKMGGLLTSLARAKKKVKSDDGQQNELTREAQSGKLAAYYKQHRPGANFKVISLAFHFALTLYKPSFPLIASR